MKGDAHVLFLHGIGEQTEHFADYARAKLGGYMRDRGLTLHSLPVCYSALLEPASKAFQAASKAHGSDGNMSQRMSINVLSDALAYRADTSVGEAIFSLIDQRVADLRDGPISFVTHSLGGLVALDYMAARPALRVDRLVTMGCNVGLFTLGRRAVVPHQVAASGRFFNLFYEADALGWPLAGVTPGMESVVDVKLPRKIASWSLLVPGASHCDYWTHRAALRTVAGCF